MVQRLNKSKVKGPIMAQSLRSRSGWVLFLTLNFRPWTLDSYSFQLRLNGALAYNLSLEHLVWTNLNDERWRLAVKRGRRVSM
jgi:hypothetical protein